jgi:hypothetical protein
MTPSLAERYVRLGLQLGRYEDGIVDAYFGPPELAAAVDAAPPVEPRVLVAEAAALLDELDEGWLRDQVVGLRAYAGVLAGDSPSFADEVEACYGVRPAFTEESVFEAAHAQLDELLSGEGTLAERHERWRESMFVPSGKLERVLAGVFEEARAWTQRIVDLPAGEQVTLEVVRDEPWMAFCYYLGGLASRIAVNQDLPQSALELLVLAAHETYPGHHTERACKDHALVRGRGLLEESIVLVPTPQSLIAEGIATVAPRLLLESEAGARLAAVVHDAGIELDLPHALAVDQASQPCRWAEVNAAIMLHERGAPESDVHAYLVRWGLVTAGLADHIIRFFKEPSSRTYIVTYPAGRALCGAYVDGRPERFRQLLTEQVRVRDLLGELR